MYLKYVYKISVENYKVIVEVGQKQKIFFFANRN